jgi:hypothetical protein
MELEDTCGGRGTEIAATPAPKRPIPIYFIACWSFVILALQSRGLVRAGRIYLSDGPEAEKIWRSAGGLLLILLVWHVVRLIRLQPFNRWLSAVSFFLATISVIYFLFIRIHELERPFAAIAGGTISGLLSLTSGLYLAHKRFRERAVQFVLERDRDKNSRMMQTASAKAILKELKK